MNSEYDFKNSAQNPYVNRLNNSQLTALIDAIHYLHMDELKSLCNRLSLAASGKKGEIIARILAFVRNGAVDS